MKTPCCRSGHLARLYRVVRFAVLCAAMMLASAMAAAPAANRVHGGVDAAPEGVAFSDWPSIRAAYEASRHAAFAVQGGHEARNPEQQWLTKWDGRGFTTQPDAGGWQWGLELRSYGWAGNERAISWRPDVQAAGPRVSYMWDARLREWFSNDARGLEHGFTLKERPEEIPDSEGPIPDLLAFTLAVRGDLRPEITADGLGVRFVNAHGVAGVTYTGLKVWDADGKSLRAHFVPADAGLRLIVEDGGRYPLTIDPLAQQAYLKASNTGAGDIFGTSIATSGDTVVVGASAEASNATGVNGNQADNSSQYAGAAYVFVRNGTTWTQQAYLKASNTGQDDEFGVSVAVSGDTIVVGARGESSNATGVNGNQADNSKQFSGAAYVFVRSGTTWTQQAYLKASNSDTGDAFGVSVALSGDTVLVGAYAETSNATGVNGNQADNSIQYAGAAYVFVRNGTTWTQQAYLKASNTGANDLFGVSVAVSGDTAVIGAPDEDSNATGVNGNQADNTAENAGATYIFARNGSAWTQQAYLKASNTDEGDLFGVSVAVSADTAVIGSRWEDSNATGVNGNQTDNSRPFAGAAYVFVRSGTTWTQQAYLKASNTDSNDIFGGSVAVSGDAVVIGASGESSNATGVNGNQADNSSQFAGAAYVFVRSGTIWTQQSFLKASNTEAMDNFGWSVGISANTVVVGASAEASNATGVGGTQADNSAAGSGAAYVFALSGSGVDLSNLTLSSGTLSPTFSPSITGYAASVGFNRSTIKVTPTKLESNGSVKVRVNGGTYVVVPSGTLSGPLALNEGPNTVDVLVTSEDLIGTKTYTITVTRLPIATGDIEPNFTAGMNDLAFGMAEQADGKILLGGGFSSVNGVTRKMMARLDAKGTLDPAFFDPTASDQILSAVVLEDGRILIGGQFFSVGGMTRNCIGRLNADGTVDRTFNPNANAQLRSVVLQPDGKILIGGFFTTVSGVARNRIARLNADGSLDAAFDPDADDPDDGSTVQTIAVQPDGKIIIGGFFTTVGGMAHNSIARLNADGTPDATFNPDVNFTIFFSAVQPDEKILIGGQFTAVNGMTHNRLARLNSDGTLDSGFNPDLIGLYTRCATLQADGKIIIGGSFETVNGASRNDIVRLNADGTLDATFNPNEGSLVSNAFVPGVTVLKNGMVALTGGFSDIDGVPRAGLALLHNDAATQSLTTTSISRVQWLRGGTSPEAIRVSFELSSNGGTAYSQLGAGMRISGGWELTGLSLPSTGLLRARALTFGGANNGFGGLVETVEGFGPNPNDHDNDGLLDSFEQTFWGSTTGHLATDDFDGDGYSELLELAFGLNPTQPNIGGLPAVVSEGDYLTMAITKHIGVIYEVQSGGTLLAGQPDSFSAGTTTVLINNATTLKVRDNFPVSTSPPRFMRVKVTAAP